MAMTTEAPESVLTVATDEKSLNMIEAIAAECKALSAEDVRPMIRAMKVAQGIKMLRDLLSKNVMEEIMRLQGTRLGFKADKTYPVDVVRECVIEATIMGAFWVGNEFNIIANNAYLTKEFYTRALAEFEGLTELRLQPGVPEVHGDTARVAYRATWKYRGVEDEIDCAVRKDANGVQADYRIPVKVVGQASVDNLLGKAERKMRKRIYDRLTGTTQNMPDGDADDAIDVTAKPPVQTLEDLTKKLETNGAAKPEETPLEESMMLGMESRISEAESLDRLKQTGEDIAAVKKSKAQRDRLETLYRAKKKELGG